MSLLNFNWIDYLILAVLFFYAYGGYSSGFIAALLDFINFVLSFIIGLKFYGFFAGILISSFSMPAGISNAIGFFVISFIAQILIDILLKKYISFEPKILKEVNKILGILPGILSGAVLTSFILVLVITLPVSSVVKRSLSESRIGNFFLSNSQGLETTLNKIFGGAINETINFLTVEPRTNQNVALNFKTKNTLPDPIAEKYMFDLVNKERSSRGLKSLEFDYSLRNVGRAHCQDMFIRGYFSHYTPEGASPFDRMASANISYNAAGENLALSPNTDIAMQGLMNSPGHKANILSIYFGRIGVGVINGGIYGEMFCQEFTD